MFVRVPKLSIFVSTPAAPSAIGAVSSANS